MGSRKVSDVVEIAKKESAVKFTANFLAALTFSLFAAFSWAQERAVYHFDGGVEQATKGLRNINNHLEVDPKARLIAVAHADGVAFLMEGAKDRFGPFDPRVQDLMGEGVKLQVCAIPLLNRKLSKHQLRKEQFILAVEFVLSGVVQITHLQQKEGYAYLKP